jgi:D-3-phosphoglycerate dehydrogenase
MSGKVLITDYVWPNIDAERHVLEAAGYDPIVAPDTAPATLARLAADVDAIMFCFAQVPAEVLRAAPSCKVASRYGIGVDNIDIAACTDLGIVVTNVPDYCLGEVADHALCMILALNRRIVPHDRAVKSGGWSGVKLNQPMHRTSDSTLGVIGYGRIGRTIATRAASFGIRVLAYDPMFDVGSQQAPATMVDFDTVLRESEFITIHVPLTPETRHMIGREQLARMKPGSIIVNCARGGLIDEAALAEALESGHLAGAGLDVVDPTPPPSDHPLFRHENVIITPHTAFFSQASTLELETRTAQEVVRVLNGEKPQNLVNPAVLGKSRIGL